MNHSQVKGGLLRFSAVLLVGILFLAGVAFASEEEKEVTLLFTHDIHSHLQAAVSETGDGETGGMAKLSTLLKQEKNDRSIYVDGGDIAMGTLFQCGFGDQAIELRMLGKVGCDITTFGNHEFDLGGYGLAHVLEIALESGDPLPEIVQSNIDFSGTLTDEQTAFKRAMDEYGVRDYFIKEINGVKVAFFGLEGPSSIDYSATSGQKWYDYISAAKALVPQLRREADVVVCLSHCGTTGNGQEGEDIELAKAVPGIDIIVSAHSHSILEEPVYAENGTVLVSCGSNLDYLGKLTFTVSDGRVRVKDYALLPLDESVPEDPVITGEVETFKQQIVENYLSVYAKDPEEKSAAAGPGAVSTAVSAGSPAVSEDPFKKVICHAPFDFITLDEMYASTDEFPMGDLIADAYRYEAEKNGIDQIDICAVALGTIRGSFKEGDITLEQAFDICSLGVGEDGSAGHPLIGFYVTGKEVKLMLELDASLGPMVDSIRMSYSGLSYTYNEKRMLLDRVTEAHLVRPDGSTEAIDDDRLYYCCINMYSANMLTMLNDLTKGLLTLTFKDENGVPVTDYYDLALKRPDGVEIKEWIAFKDYLQALGTIPDAYRTEQGRKIRVSEGGLAVIAHPGTATILAGAVGLILLLIVILIIRLIVRRMKKRKQGGYQK